MQACALKIFASTAEFDRELEVYKEISKLASCQDLPLSRLVCPLQLTRSTGRHAPKVPPYAGALVVWPLADTTLANLQYNCQSAFSVALSMLRALTALHDLGLCHADMSNTNVLIQLNEPIKVGNSSSDAKHV